MMGRPAVLAFALVTAASGTALAREPCDPPHRPAGYGYPPGPPPAAAYGRPSDSGSIEAGLRDSDLDRNGWVTLDEALARGRREFRRADRDGDRVLSRHELAWERGPRGRARGRWDGRVTRFEYQDAVRSEFARLDRNRDGVLGRHELGLGAPRPARSAGWWPYR